MEKVHTPTPWEIRFLIGTDIEIRGSGYGQICKFSGLSHSTELMDDYGPTEKANAEFIVEACNSHYSLTSELKELKEENARLKGTLGVEGVRQNLELKEENAELIKLLTEYLSVIQEYRKLTGKGTDVESALSKHQPIKKDENV